MSVEQSQERYFSEKQMYAYLEQRAKEDGMGQTETALPLSRRLHEGQFRKGTEQVPYIIHPLTLACHALALGLNEDALVAALLLHDVCEDCGAEPEDLPVNETVRETVRRLTYRRREEMPLEENKKMYFDGIAADRLACVAKVIDRCNNISTMTFGFSEKKMSIYIRETERYVMPLLEVIRKKWPEHGGVAFLIEYQMKSVMESLKNIMQNG